MIAAEQPGGNTGRARHHDQPRADRPGRGYPAELSTEHHRPGAEHHEAGHHDLRIPGILRGQAAELHLGSGVTGLTQRASHPRRGEQYRARDTARRRQPAEPHRASITLPGPPRCSVLMPRASPVRREAPLPRHHACPWPRATTPHTTRQ
jgi:hypothetical protein